MSSVQVGEGPATLFQDTLLSGSLYIFVVLNDLQRPLYYGQSYLPNISIGFLRMMYVFTLISNSLTWCQLTNAQKVTSPPTHSLTSQLVFQRQVTLLIPCISFQAPEELCRNSIQIYSTQCPHIEYAILDLVVVVFFI